MKTQPLILILMMLSVLAPVALAADLVPFVIPSAPSGKSLIDAPPGEPLKPGGDRVVARGGHFYLGDRRFRVWGVNLCFGANLPSHDDARNVAARLAAAGVNSVRLHHMDNGSFPRGIWDAKDPMKLSAESLDRLDYFVDQLASRGVTVNLNLHVSRTHSRYLSDLPPVNTSYDKIVGIFTPVLIEAQKKYARDMLTHVNAYRKVRYADDPAIAFIEITNEDSLFMWSAARDLPALPDYYAGVLRARFAKWLQKRYGSTDALRKAWSAGAEPLGANMLADTAFDMKPPKDPNQPHWTTELHEGCKAAATKGKEPNSVRVEIAKANSTNWHIQFKQPHLPVRKGRYYTVMLRARADRPRKISCGVSQAHDPWGNLGLTRSIDLTDKWLSVRMGFVATADDDARLIFSLGGETTAVELADLSMGPGGQVGLRDGESIEAANIAVFADSEVERRLADRWRFLTETEKAYFDDMRSYVRKDLGCGAPVTGTIVFGPCGLYGQSDMDFIDVHSYWLHPRFPGRPWDPANWVVEQRAMTDTPAGATLWGLGSCRLAGAPFTCSEYNHPAPNDYQAECVPMIAAFAAAQDWDGIWLFAYCHRTNDWNRGSFAGFFDIDTNPSKWGFMRAGAAIFRDAGLAPVPAARTLQLAPAGDTLSAVANLHRTYDRNMARIFGDKLDTKWSDMLTDRLYVTLGGSGAIQAQAVGAVDTRLTWSVDKAGRGRFVARSARAIVETGWSSAAGGQPTFGALAVTPLDGKGIEESAAVLITACGRCENTGMKYSPDRRTVGRDWGGEPVLIEPLDRTVKLPCKAGEVRRLQPLGPDGAPRGAPVEVKIGADGAIRISPEHKTMWYLLTRP